MRRTTAERFWSKVDKSGECWLWTGWIFSGRRGYGGFDVGTKSLQAHRFAYTEMVGPIPDGLELDHLCRVRHCVNPDHLEPVTHQENMRRSEPAQRTHCPRNHEYTEANTRVSNGKRSCRRCHRIHQANYLMRRAAA